ncbi:hypothetical protein [Actinoplanes sp. NPDC051851]|uniref:hypothetical protein n=1 Tax=Actinoplanes sp. NPDC051851 TaxID=3154753 RepID=UPI0034176C61
MLLEPKGPWWKEYLGPAAVILAGVLAVLTVAGVLYGLSHPPATDATPLVGEVADPATGVPIPLPSPSPSMSTTPIDDITFERGTVPDTVNLSSEGKIDWVHWGEEGTYSLERATGGGFAILEGTPSSPRRRHTLSPEKFRWTGGTPAPKDTGTTSGIRTCGKGHGFTLSAPAGPEPQTLRLYVGAVAARGELRMSLNTGGETVTTTFEQKGTSMATARYTVSYRASATGKISIEWITDKSYDEDCGGVALQAATLF